MNDLIGLLKDHGVTLEGSGSMRTSIIVLSNQGEKSVVAAGYIDAEHVGFEPLTASVIRALRRDGVAFSDGDCLFFPDASPGHRAYTIEGDSVSRRP